MSDTTEATETSEVIPEAVAVWVCPNCGGWYASSSSVDLSSVQNIRSAMRNLATEDSSEWGKSTGSRAICQVCRQQGKGDFERQLVSYVRVDVVVGTINEHLEAERDRASQQVPYKRENFVDDDANN